MISVRSRLLAAATTLVVAGAAVLGGAAAATALPPSITITHTNPTADAATDLQFQVSRVDHCDVVSATRSVWVHPTGSSWEEVGYSTNDLDLSSGSTTFTVPALGAGTSVHIEVDTLLNCDGETEKGTIDVTPLPVTTTTPTTPTTPTTTTPTASMTFQGVVHQANGMGALETPVGATATLVRVVEGVEDAEVASVPVNESWGGFDLTVPGEGEFVIRVTTPGYPTVYFTEGLELGQWSATSFAEATIVRASSPYEYRQAVFVPEPWKYTGEDTVTGVAYGPTGSGAAVTATLYRLDEAVFTAVDTDETGLDGAFQLTAPVTAEGEQDLYYVIGVDFGGDEVRYYRAGADEDEPSASHVGDATFLTPAEFDAETSYDVYAAGAAGLSETDAALICGYWNGGEDAVSYDYSTQTVGWSDACATDGSIDEAETAHREDAFDGFGYVVFAEPGADVPHPFVYDEEGYYVVTADSYSRHAVGDRDVLVLWDEDVAAFDSEGEPVDVDVRVEREIGGSWTTWSVVVYLAGTDELATDVPFFFVGDLGSDDETAWTISDGYAVSTDGDDEEDPVIGHRFSASGDLTEDGEGGLALASTGALHYAVGVFDYACWGDDLADQALPIVATKASVFTDLAPLQGVCPTWDFPAPSLFVDLFYDSTTTAPWAGWNWTYGGTIDVVGLPEGLEFEVIDEWESDTPPSLRIFGTPESAGEYDFTVYVSDDYGHKAAVQVTGAIEVLGPQSGGEGPIVTPERQLELVLDLAIGQKVAGAPATATAKGLQQDAPYDLVVRSTPQTLATGTVPAGGTVTRTVTLPVLEPGWHSLTFTSEWNGGGTAAARVWFLVAADGTLVRISSTAPALAATGADVAGAVALGSLLLVAGFGLIALRRRAAAVRAA